MVEIKSGTVFNTDAEALVNTVNCKGVMGAGIALEFQLRYPEMFEDYRKKCESGLIKVGTVDYYKADDLTIINFPTKYDFRYPSKIEWVESGLANFVDTFKEYDIHSVAFPKLGAGRGGLDWDAVKDIMLKYLEPLDIKVYICEDSLTYPEGVEKDMLDRLNSTNLQSLSKDVKLAEKQMKSIEDKRPLQRFWQLEKIENIGATTYGKLFNYFYELSKGTRNEQLTLF